MRTRKLLDRIALVLVGLLIVAALYMAYHELRLSWALRVLPDAMAQVHSVPSSVPACRRAMTAARIVARHPSDRCVHTMSAALRAARMDAERCCVQVDTEMAMLDALVSQALEGSGSARGACLSYLADSARFVEAHASDDPHLCATVVPQQLLILGALDQLGDGEGLGPARQLACHAVPIVVIDAVTYVGRFGDVRDLGAVHDARQRMAECAPPEVMEVALAACDRAAESICERSETASAGSGSQLQDLSAK